MAATYRSTGVSPGADSTSCVVVKPASLAVGDLMIAQIVGTGATIGSFTAPDGTWNSIRQDTFVGTVDVGSALWWKIATQTDVDATNFTFTATGASSNCGAIAAFYGQAVSSPINASNGQQNAASTTITSPAITPSIANCVICLFGAMNDNNVLSNWRISTSNPASWSASHDLSKNLANDLVLAMSYATRPETTSTGNGLITSNGSDGNVGQMVAIAPLLVTTGYKTFVLISRLRKQFAKTYALISRLRKLSQVDYALTARLALPVLVYYKTYLLESRLRKQQSRNYLVFASLFRQWQATYQIEGRLRAIRSKTYLLTALITSPSATRSKEYLLTARLNKEAVPAWKIYTIFSHLADWVYGSEQSGKTPALKSKAYILAGNLKRSYAKTYAIFARLLGKQSKSYQMAVRLRKQTTRTYQLQSRLKHLSAQRPYQLQARVFRPGVPKQYVLVSRLKRFASQKNYSLYAVLSAAGKKTYQITVTLKRLAAQKSYSLFSRLASRKTKTYGLSATLHARKAATYSLTSRLAALVSKTRTYLLAVRLSRTRPKSYSIISRLAGRRVYIYQLQVRLKTLAKQKIYAVGTRLFKRMPKTYQLGIRLKKLSQTKSYSLQSRLRIVRSKTYLLEARLLKQGTAKAYVLAARLSKQRAKPYILAAKLIAVHQKTYLLTAKIGVTQRRWITYKLEALFNFTYATQLYLEASETSLELEQETALTLYAETDSGLSLELPTDTTSLYFEDDDVLAEAVR